MEQLNQVKKILNKELARRLIRKKKITKKIFQLYNRCYKRKKTFEELNFFRKLLINRSINNAKIKELRKQINMKSVQQSTQQTAQPIKMGSIAKELLTYALSSFKKKFDTSAMYTQAEFIISMNILKGLLKTYEIQQIKNFIEQYYNLDEEFLRNAGYKLRFLPSKINTIIAIQNKTRTKHQDFNKKDYGKSLSDSQLREYIKMKKNGECTGSEIWAKEYEKELSDREINE
jgi:hypothetical protein